ncbi:MAG: hypothetical protein QOH71_1716 [Blastocatellia bacterium]|jgi:hypothetical protein|nr:hypothetical protein [Blastocatellia bacterium]
MKRSKFSETQIISILKAVEAGRSGFDAASRPAFSAAGAPLPLEQASLGIVCCLALSLVGSIMLPVGSVLSVLSESTRNS